MNQLFFTAWRAMGCEVSIQLETECDGQALLSSLPAQVEAIEALLSRFRSDSELMQLNAQAGHWVTVSAMLFDNIRTAKHAARLTDGRFNPLVLPSLIALGYDRSFAEIGHPVAAPPRPAADWNGIELHLPTHEVRLPANSALDLGGIAKGWTAAHLADGLALYGACLVNFGGDLVARGAPQNLPGWEVGVADPFNTLPLATLWLRDASLMTSGTDFRHWTTSDGVQQHHIVDPRTGQAAETDLLSVTIYHPHAPTAEAYTKAVFLLGAEAGLKWLQAQWHAAGLVVRHDGSVLTTPKFANLTHERSVL